MPAPPLTHHEILTLVEPFTRAGRHVDLGASNRIERRLLFKPVEHPGGADGTPALRETLQLDSFGTGTCRLTRTLSLPGGLQASLRASGPRPGELLAHITAIDPRRQFRFGTGCVVALCYVLQWDEPAGADEPAAPQAILTQGVAQCEGLRLTLTLPSLRGVAAEIALEPTPGAAPLELPEDLLAVLGWNWARLIRGSDGWRSKLRVRGNTARRSRAAEGALERAGAHLATTLAESPQRYHERWAGARWGVVFRRGIPVLTFLMLIGTIALAPHFVIEGNPGLWLLLFHVPTALIALSFCLQELPQYEIPPLPRRGAAPSWHKQASPPRDIQLREPLGQKSD